MNLNDIVLRSRSWLKMYTKIRWTELELVELANDVQDELGEKIRMNDPDYYKTSTTKGLVSNDPVVELPQDFVSIKRIEKNSQPTVEIYFEEFADRGDFLSISSTSNEYPSRWTWDGMTTANRETTAQTIRLLPTPTVTEADYLRIWYVRQPRRMTSGLHTPDIPRAYHILIPKKIRYALLDASGVNADRLLMEIQNMETNMLSGIYFRQVQNAPLIRSITNYGE